MGIIHMVMYNDAMLSSGGVGCSLLIHGSVPLAEACDCSCFLYLHLHLLVLVTKPLQDRCFLRTSEAVCFLHYLLYLCHIFWLLVALLCVFFASYRPSATPFVRDCLCGAGWRPILLSALLFLHLSPRKQSEVVCFLLL